MVEVFGYGVFIVSFVVVSGVDLGLVSLVCLGVFVF